MQRQLTQVEVCRTFAEASRSARRFAALIDAPAFVQRSGHDWVVLADPDDIPDTSDEVEEDEPEISDDEYYEREVEHYLRHEVLGPLGEEILEEEDNSARSNEGGWYYED
jgi:hypothetical protein